MARNVRKTAVVVAPEAPANPALDIQAMIAREIAKALGNLALPAGPADPASPPPALKPPVETTVIPPKTTSLTIADGYWQENQWTPYSAGKGKEPPFKLQGLKGAFQGVPLTLLAEMFERIEDVERAIEGWNPKAEVQKALKARLYKAIGI